MKIDKIYEMLGLEKLDESKQNEVKEALVTLIDTKAQEKTTEKVEEEVAAEKERLVEEFETKFEDYKTEIIEKFSNFVDDIIEEEMVIPENIVEYARLGELYHDVIEQFKTRLAIDEGMIQDEVKNLLKEAKEEITSLRTSLNEETAKNLEIESDAKKMATNLYLYSKCEGLTESQKKTIVGLLEDETSKEKIDEKFDTILESLKLDMDDDKKTDDKKIDENKKVDEKNKDGKGVTLNENLNGDNLEDDPTFWSNQVKQWTTILENNKI